MQNPFEVILPGVIIGLFLVPLCGWNIGLPFGLTFGLSIGLLRVIETLEQDLQPCATPNQGILNSLKNLLWTALLLGVGWIPRITTQLTEIAGEVNKDKAELVLLKTTRAPWSNVPLNVSLDVSIVGISIDAVVAGIFISLFLSFLVGGGVACIQHLCLRIILTHTRTIPWNFARFLNYCTERRLLQRIGGRYRFLHRELLDHFADLRF